LVQGELACVQGDLFVVFKLWFGGLRSLLDHSFLTDVSSRFPCLSDLAFCLCLAFEHLLEFLFIRFFCFSFLSCYYLWVLSMHSSRGD
jgi:hypothetical protein